jgi:hypothetical protein
LGVDVRRGETQEPESGVEKPILAAIVFGQAIPMVRPVVLQDQAGGGVVQVRPSEDSILVIAQIHLHLGSGEAAPDEQPSQSRFHRRFGGRGHGCQRT